VLTDAECLAIYEDDVWPTTPILQCYIESLDEYAVMVDRSGNGNDGACNAGTSFVYSDQAFRIPTHAALEPKHAALCWRNGKYAYHQAHASQVFFAEQDVYGDADGLLYPTLVVSTPWLSLAGVQNFQRVRMVRVSGEYQRAHDLKIELLHDFETDVEQTVYFDEAAVLGLVHGVREQASIHVKRQRCESVRVRITTVGRRHHARWESVALEFGKEPGLKPLAHDVRR
jgi:hypothetical protein